MLTKRSSAISILVALILIASFMVAVLPQTISPRIAHAVTQIVVYNSNGTWTVPTGVTSVQVLVVAGGGGGGNNHAGGGGGGGYVYTAAKSVTPGNILTVTIGNGGAGSTSKTVRGTNGSNSVFGDITATGGGGGGCRTDINSAAKNGADGGSGGGGGGDDGAPTSIGGTGSQGYNGGGGYRTGANSAGGGGGGAGAIGATAASYQGGNGGAGVASSISGSSVTYAGGGGGGASETSSGHGGTGADGGGNGGYYTTNPTAGVANRGGGGGGGKGNAGNGGAGGSGIVIISYVTPLTVTTQAVTGITRTTATGNGNIANVSVSNPTRRGFCYMSGTSGDPTTANSVVYDDGSFGTGAYTKSITGLTAGTGYRVRAYAVDSQGTSYGATVQMYTVANWGVSGYAYRKTITVTGTTAGAQTNYQMMLTVSNASGVSSCLAVYLNGSSLAWPNDVRFTAADGTTLLSFWIEQSNTTAGTWWVKFDTIPASPDNGLFYIYWGKASEASASDGTNTFTFFDDFGSFNSTYWTQVLAGGTVTYSNSIVTLDNTNASSSVGLYTNSAYGTKPFIIEAKYQRPSFYRNRMYDTTSAGGGIPLSYDYGDFAPSIYWNGFTGTTLSNNVWYIVQWIDTNSNYTWNILNTNYSTVISRSYGSSISSTGYIEFLGTENTSSDLKLDWVRWRKYASPEPTCGTWGSTETNAAPTITSVTLQQSDKATATSSMTPQTAYNVEIVAGDADTIYDINQIDIWIFYEGDANHNGSPAGAWDCDQEAIYRWAKSGSTWSMQNGAATTTWSITTGSCDTPADMTATSGEWNLYFTVGKLAIKADGSSTAWDIKVTVTDSVSHTASSTTYNKSMGSYASLSLSSSTVSFGSISMGSTAAIQTPASHYVTLQATANSAFSLGGKSSSPWTSGSNSVTLDPSGTPTTSGSFALTYDDAGDGNGHPTTPQAITTSTATITGHNADARTSTTAGASEGTSNTNMYTDCKLYSSGIPYGTYSGTITFTITN